MADHEWIKAWCNKPTSLPTIDTVLMTKFKARKSNTKECLLRHNFKPVVKFVLESPVGSPAKTTRILESWYKKRTHYTSGSMGLGFPAFATPVWPKLRSLWLRIDSGCRRAMRCWKRATIWRKINWRSSLRDQVRATPKGSRAGRSVPLKDRQYSNRQTNVSSNRFLGYSWF